MNEAITICDESSGATAQVAVDLGFNCFQFTVEHDGRQIDIIDSPDDVLTGNYRPSGFGIPILFPFPNRIEKGTFRWDDQQYNIPLSPGHPHALHGFCYDRPWRVVAQTSDSVTGQFQLSLDDPERAESWPTDFIFEVRYRVVESRLETQFKIHNPGTRPLPWGLGTHAYFSLPFGAESSASDCVFQVPVHEEWEIDEAIPTGRRIPADEGDSLIKGIRFGTQKFDNVFTGWENDGGTVRTSIIDEKAGLMVAQVCDADLFRHAVVYTPKEREAVCLEPYTCTTNAINLEEQDVAAGLQQLAPGETVQTWIALQVSPVYA